MRQIRRHRDLQGYDWIGVINGVSIQRSSGIFSRRSGESRMLERKSRERREKDLQGTRGKGFMETGWRINKRKSEMKGVKVWSDWGGSVRFSKVSIIRLRGIFFFHFSLRGDSFNISYLIGWLNSILVEIISEWLWQRYMVDLGSLIMRRLFLNSKIMMGVYYSRLRYLFCGYLNGTESRSFPISSHLFSRYIICILILFLHSVRMTQGSWISKGSDSGRKNLVNKMVKVTVPHFDNSGLIKGYAQTLIGRCFNPKEQDVKSLIIMLPKIWKMEDRIVGADLGLGRFQFDFDKEEDILEILKMQPFHFDGWMVSLVRWQPVRDRSYPSDITFWIRVMGVPIEFWAQQTFESVGTAIGRVEEIDMDLGRIKVVLDGGKPLIFEVNIEFKGGEFHEGEETVVSLKYEKLFGYCDICFSLCHDDKHCPFSMEPPPKDKAGREKYPADSGVKAASYKGVVIRGTEESKESSKRVYQGKGKGKMYEEKDSHWLKQASKESRSWYSSRDRARGEDRDSRLKSPQKSNTRRFDHGDRHRFSGARGRGRERSRSPRNSAAYRGRSIERGTFQHQSGSSKDEQVNDTNPVIGHESLILANPNKGGLEEVEQGEIKEDGLEVVNEVLMESEVAASGTVVDAGEAAEMEEEDSQSAAEGELMEAKEYEENMEEQGREDSKEAPIETNHGAVGEVAKAKGARKKLFLKVPTVGGTSRKRMVNNFLSPRKRNQVKTVQKDAEVGSRVEEQDPSKHPPGASKP